MEVRFHLLRPEQIYERRREFPVVYIPLGTLEWHGLHNPMGADGLQAEALAVRCATIGGGLVFPTVYYGESRVGSLLETAPDLKAGVAERMKVPLECFDEERHPYSHSQQIEHYHHHLVHILGKPRHTILNLPYFCRSLSAADHAGRRYCFTINGAMIKMGKWAHGLLPISDCCVIYTIPGDHAGGWETSHLLAHPETVDLSRAEKSLQYGIMSSRDPSKSTAEFETKHMTTRQK